MLDQQDNVVYGSQFYFKKKNYRIGDSICHNTFTSESFLHDYKIQPCYFCMSTTTYWISHGFVMFSFNFSIFFHPLIDVIILLWYTSPIDYFPDEGALPCTNWSLPILPSSFSLGCWRFFLNRLLWFSAFTPTACCCFGWFLWGLYHGVILQVIIVVILWFYRWRISLARLLHHLFVLCAASPSLLWRCADGVRCLETFFVVGACECSFHL